jgi:hypothetical protein
LEVDRVLNSNQVSWKVKEKLRSGENCFNCINYGGGFFCLRYIQGEDNEVPGGISDNLICDEWEVE